jgi:hypothetical protein
MMFPVAKMKTSFPPLTVSFLRALPLHEKFAQRHFAGSKNAEIAVKGHDPFIGLQGQGSAYGNGFLPDTAEPFGDLSLPQQHQHFFLDHAGPEQYFIKIDQLITGKFFSVEVHER